MSIADVKFVCVECEELYSLEEGIILPGLVHGSDVVCKSCYEKEKLK